jgi:hypothetical protein
MATLPIPTLPPTSCPHIHIGRARCVPLADQRDVDDTDAATTAMIDATTNEAYTHYEGGGGRE